ncbi:MAG: hypothetical protein AAGE94_04435 [Acidobacteriota bacterium]
MARWRHRRRDDVLGGEYTVVTVQPSWWLLSLACFLATLTVEFWLRWLPWQPEYTWQVVYWRFLAIAATAGVGFVLALIGVLTSDRRQASRWVLGLNGVSLVLVGLTFLGMRLIMGR